MPSDSSASASVKRPGITHRNSHTSGVAQSPNESQTNTRGHAHHKPPRHVVGYGRVGARNPSFGRTLSKINISAAQSAQDDNGPQSARLASNGTPLLSPRHKQGMKRTNTSLALGHRAGSQTALKKNLSSGQLHRVASSKHNAKQSRPEVKRSHSHQEKSKSKQSPPPPANGGQHTSVHFDMGSDEDGDEMEGVDDAWTEESASQSPNTTRDNTRSNTRQNSVILAPEENPYKKQEQEPPDEAESDTSSPKKSEEVNTKDFAVTSPVAQNSYQEEHQARPPDAEAIAKRLLQRSQKTSSAPQVSEVSARANTDLDESKRFRNHDQSAIPSPSQGSAPMVSRFVTESKSMPGSKDGTPQNPSQLEARRREHERIPTVETIANSDMKRNQSTPSFTHPFSPAIPDGFASGTTTPGGTLRPSRTQQKLWLQRGLSNIEANSQRHLPGMLTAGGTQRGGTASRQFEIVEKELAVVRRFRDPVAESVERLRRMRKAQQKGVDAMSDDTSPKKKGRTREDTMTPRIEAPKSQASTPSAGRSKVSFALSAPDDEDDQSDAQLDWNSMSLDELEDATLDLRRQMWELHSPGDAD